MTEVDLEKVSSELNPLLIVSLKNGKFQLGTEKAIYSYDEKYDNFVHAFSKVNLPKDQSEILILGFGLGSIPLILENLYSKKYIYQGVEIDHAVIELASKYTLPRLSSPVEIIEANALYYLQSSENQFPLICMDVFQSDITPTEFRSIDFLKNLKQHLIPEKGILLYNCLAYNKEDIQTTQLFFENNFRTVFPEAGYIKSSGNWVLLNDARLGNN